MEPMPRSIKIVAWMLVAFIVFNIGRCLCHAGTPEQLAIINANQGAAPAAAINQSVTNLSQISIPPTTQWPAGFLPLQARYTVIGKIYVTADGTKWATLGSNHWRPTSHTECRVDRNGDRYGCHLVSDIPAAIQPTTVTAARTEPRRILQRGK